MITDADKRQAGLNLLQRLRRQGAPGREAKVESMFDSLTGTGEGGEDEEVEESEYEMQSPEEIENERKGPKLDQKKVEKYKKGFMSVK